MSVLLLHLAQLGEGRVTAGSMSAQCADAFGHFINRQRQLAILRHEQGVQGGEHRTGHVPMVVMRLQVQRIAARQ